MISVSKPLVQSSEIEVKAESGAYRRTNYIESGEKDAPLAYTIEYESGRVSSTHYHTADQFQVVIEGGGTIGRHVVRPLAVHFSRAYTPYGPLIANSTAEGMTFLTTGVVRIVQPPKQNSAWSRFNDGGLDSHLARPAC